MTEAEELRPLMLDLVAWAAAAPRRYDEVMDAWRTSCPRLPVWETSVDLGYLRRECANGDDAMVRVTDAGHGFLARHGRAAA